MAEAAQAAAVPVAATAVEPVVARAADQVADPAVAAAAVMVVAVVEAAEPNRLYTGRRGAHAAPFFLD